MKIDDSKRLSAMGMNASHNKDVLLIAILRETDDLTSRNHWTLRDKLARLHALGNAVVPQVVYPLMVMVREMLEEMNS